MTGVKTRFLLPPALSLAAALAFAAPSASFLGYWKTPVGSIIRVESCGANVCLRIAVLPPHVPGTDIHNPDPALRNRSLCNLQIGSGFRLSDADHASGGTLYDPRTGKTYHGAMSAEGARLHLRGYVGIPLFGASQTWTRTAEPAQPCSSR